MGRKPPRRKGAKAPRTPHALASALEIGHKFARAAAYRAIAIIMPITSRGFARTSLALLVIGVLTLVGIVAATVWLVERTQIHFELVVDGREARRAAVEMRSLLQDAQNGQRGFLLTRDESYLEPYTLAAPQLLPAFERLVAALAEHKPDALPQIEGLRPELIQKREELARTIALARTGEVDAALAIVRTDLGQELMEEMRTALDALIADVDEMILAGVEDQRGAAMALRIVAIAGALIIIAVLGAAVWVVTRYTRDLDLARTEVATLNADLEMRVAERTEDLQRANEEVQRFAYIVTHDLRAPLVNIMGFTSELEAALPPIRAVLDSHAEDDPLAAEARQAAVEDLPEAIDFIRSSTRKMDGLINAILKISREGRRQLKAERLDIAAMMETAVAAIRHQIDENGGSVSLDIRTPPVFSDKLALEQIVGNLLDNAVKYRHPARPVEIAVSAFQEPNGRVVIDIADNGRGIAPGDHDRVFELFRRSGAQDQPGEGIGLAHVRIMARNLGGEITLTSTQGEGTTFRVTLAPDLRTIVRRP